MKDLSLALEEAKVRGGFDEDTFRTTLQQISSEIDEALLWDWDSGVPENWASGRIGGLRVVLLWLGGQFAFIDHHAPQSLSRALAYRGITIEAVADWNAADYALDRTRADVLFDGPFPHDDVDVTALSIQDLWWATVT